jgi:putative aldouronate transport system substrate-binding protein
MYTVKAREPNIVPYGMQKDNNLQYFNTYYWDNQPGSYSPVSTAYTYINVDDPAHPKAVPLWEYGGYADAVKRAHRYLQDKIFTQDALNIVGGDMQALYKQGKFAVAPEASDGLTTSSFGDTLKNVPGAQLEVVYPFSQPNPKPLNSFVMWNFLAVNKLSKYPDRVMELMDWLSIKENHDLLEYGIPGKDWQAVGDTEYKALGQYTFPGYVMSWRPSLERTPSNMLSDEKKWYDFASKVDSFTLDPMSGFIFDTKPVKSQISQLDAAATQYQVPLEHGVVDPNQGLVQLQNAFKQAGYDQVQAEVQRQVDAFVAKKNNK